MGFNIMIQGAMVFNWREQGANVGLPEQRVNGRRKQGHFSLKEHRPPSPNTTSPIFGGSGVDIS